MVRISQLPVSGDDRKQRAYERKREGLGRESPSLSLSLTPLVFLAPARFIDDREPGTG